jgi:hypothetical protein
VLLQVGILRGQVRQRFTDFPSTSTDSTPPAYWRSAVGINILGMTIPPQK